MAELLTVSNADDVARYNGISFGHKTETLSVDIRPVPDGSGRTVAYNVYTITIRGPVYVSGGSSETTMPAIRRALTAYAGEFRYVNKGLGPLIINIPGGGGTRDVVWGPKPTLLRFKPIGTAAEVTWSVEVAIPDCEHAQTQFRLMEFVFRLVFSIDQGGHTRRTYSGYIRIPQTRRTVLDRRLSDTADRYRELIVPWLPPGFRRVSQDFPLSEDKCRLDYTIVDEEMPPNIPPPGVQHATARHAVGTNKYLASTTLWQGTFSASYEITRQADRAIPFRSFVRLLTERIGIIERNAIGIPDGVKPRVLISSLSMEEPGLYDHPTGNFTATYTIPMSRLNILLSSGLWRPLGDSNWQLWAQSMRDSSYHIRGNARLRHLADEDIIIDLCDDRKPVAMRPVQIPQEGARILRQDFFKNPTPDQGTSYLRYYSRIVVATVDDTVELKALPAATESALRVPSPKPATPPSRAPGPFRSPPAGGEFLTGIVREGAPLPPVIAATAGPTAASSRPSADSPPEPASIQTRCRPTIAITLEGHAVRAGYPIVPPTLVRIGKYKAVPANRPGNGIVQEVMASWFGVPIHAGTWRFRWLVEGVEGLIPIPTNLLTGD